MFERHSAQPPSHIVEFRAGRMRKIGKMVHPDTRKGLIYMQQGEDNLIHFCWLDRLTGKVEEDLIMFPGEYNFVRVEQCRTGRVYVLKFKSSRKRLFFWMQEPREDRDVEYCKIINELIDNPAAALARVQAMNTRNTTLPSTVSQQHLRQVLDGFSHRRISNRSVRERAPTPAEIAAAVAAIDGVVAANDALAAVNTTTGNARVTTTSQATARKRDESKIRTASQTTNTANDEPAAARNTTDDATVLNQSSAIQKSEATKNPNAIAPETKTTEAVANHIVNIEITRELVGAEVFSILEADPTNIKTIAVNLPNETYDQDQLKKIKDKIVSPQFQQPLSRFIQALQSTQPGSVLTEFNLSAEAALAAHDGNLEAYAEALAKSLPADVTMD